MTLLWHCEHVTANLQGAGTPFFSQHPQSRIEVPIAGRTRRYALAVAPVLYNAVQNPEVRVVEGP